MDGEGKDMTERLPTGDREGEPQKGLEILDSERLRNHGALYGRFLKASLAKTQEEADNIIDPNNTKVEVNLAADALLNRSYNPVCERSSIAERKKQWENFKPSALHKSAYSQWQAEFTGFMNKNKDQRIRALKIILSDRDRAEFQKTEFFTVDYADHLFNDFCKDGSDVDSFIKRVTTNLASRRGKINPEYLKDQLDDLRWIASGLFGKETASNVVTRLIELESAIRNDPEQVVRFFNDNKDRINSPTDEEKGILRALLKGEIPTQVPTVPTVPEEDVSLKPAPWNLPESAPVPGWTPAASPAEDKDETPRPPPAEIIPGQKESSPDPEYMPPRAALEHTWYELLNKVSKERQHDFLDKARAMSKEEIDKIPGGEEMLTWEDMRIVQAVIQNMEKLLEEENWGIASLQDNPVISEDALEETEGNGEIVSVTHEFIRWRHDNREMTISKRDDDMWMIFYNDGSDRFSDNIFGLLAENFDLEDVVKSFKDRGFEDIEPDTAEKIYQSLAKKFSDGLKENDQLFLALQKEMPYRLSVNDPNSKKVFFVEKDHWSPGQFTYSYYTDRERTSMVTPTTLTEDDIKKQYPTVTPLLNAEIGKAVLEAWLKSKVPEAEAETGSSPGQEFNLTNNSFTGKTGEQLDDEFRTGMASQFGVELK